MKLTSSALRELVMEEVAKLKSEKLKVDAKEVDADGFADSLENHIDYIKTLRIKESKLTKELTTVREQTAAALKKLIGE